MKILALDYGRKRCGFAETDDLQMIASPLSTVETRLLWEFLEAYLRDNRVETLVVGEPFREDGSHNPLEDDIRGFIRKFTKKYPGVNIVRQDERYTSKMAFDAMIAGGLGRKKRRNKATVDKVSAALILQDYLTGRGR